MKNKFLNISVGVTMMMLGAGFLLRSMSTANAAPKPEMFLDEGTNHVGKYMFQVYMDGDHRHGLVWDTETGKSQAYGEFNMNWTPEKLFPENPLGE